MRLGQDLLGIGVLPRLRYVQSFAANPVGGITQGTDTSGVVIFGADMDLNKVVRLPGAQLHATFAQFYVSELATDHIGTRTKVQSFYYPKKQFELAELTYEQDLLDGRLNLLVGRANATGEFARSTYGCRFQDVADCPLELTQAVAGFPGFPYVNWGGRVRYNPTPGTYLKAGAFETNSTRNTNSGFDWGLNRSTGFVVPAEVGYGTDFSADPNPRHVKAGGWYNSVPYADPFLNTRGRSRGQFVFEANYNLRLVEGVFLASGLQYIVNPDQISRQSATRAPRDALVVGLKLALNVNELLSLPAVSSFR